MSGVFFRELGIPGPDRYFGIGSGSHGTQTGSIREKYRPTPGELREISQRYGWPVQEQRLIELYRQI